MGCMNPWSGLRRRDDGRRRRRINLSRLRRAVLFDLVEAVLQLRDKLGDGPFEMGQAEIEPEVEPS
jgi:hypothetical protein